VETGGWGTLSWKDVVFGPFITSSGRESADFAWGEHECFANKFNICFCLVIVYTVL
jgi:hypothetical protein